MRKIEEIKNEISIRNLRLAVIISELKTLTKQNKKKYLDYFNSISYFEKSNIKIELNPSSSMFLIRKKVLYIEFFTKNVEAVLSYEITEKRDTTYESKDLKLIGDFKETYLDKKMPLINKLKDSNERNNNISNFVEKIISNEDLKNIWRLHSEQNHLKTRLGNLYTEIKMVNICNALKDLYRLFDLKKELVDYRSVNFINTTDHYSSNGEVVFQKMETDYKNGKYYLNGQQNTLERIKKAYRTSFVLDGKVLSSLNEVLSQIGYKNTVDERTEYVSIDLEELVELLKPQKIKNKVSNF
jgi:hypothetical protein